MPLLSSGTCAAAVTLLRTLGLEQGKTLLPASGCAVSHSVLGESPLAPAPLCPTRSVRERGELGSGDSSRKRPGRRRQLPPNDLLYGLCSPGARPSCGRYAPPTFLAPACPGSPDLLEKELKQMGRCFQGVLFFPPPSPPLPSPPAVPSRFSTFD